MSRNVDDNLIKRVLACRSDELEVGSFLGDILVDGHGNFTNLKTEAGDLEAKAKRAELIEAVRAGKHIALQVTARTFRQEPKRQNRRYLRLGLDDPGLVKTFGDQPFLVDHNTYSQSARKGTVLTAKLVEETQTRMAIEMAFEAVKPDAVISVLDGTLDRFSIGWWPDGAVMCTAHNVDITSADDCGCWPGERVLVDGKLVIAEYLYPRWRGKELSGVNIPAVWYTNIEDFRLQLADELGLPKTRLSRPTPAPPPPQPPTQEKRTTMRFPRLQAAMVPFGLSMAEEPTEESLLAAWTALTTRVHAADTDNARLSTELAQANAQLGAARAHVLTSQVDHILQTEGYGTGRLVHEANLADPSKPLPSALEPWLRSLAAQPTVPATPSSPALTGLDLLKKQLSAMPIIAKVKHPLQAERVPGPPAPALLAGGDDDDALWDENNEYLVNACSQIGEDPKKAAAFIGNNHVQGG